jgi:hypothetical protein
MISSLRVRTVAARPGALRVFSLAAGRAEVLSVVLMRTPNAEVNPIPRPEIATAETRYEPPRFELICLACEISAYAPDSDLPLF